MTPVGRSARCATATRWPASTPARARIGCCSRSGTPYLARRAARPHRQRSRRASSATPTCTPGASTAATSSASPDASSASATSCRSTLRAIVRAPDGDADPAAFLPVAYRDLDELDGFLEHLAGEVRDPACCALLAAVLGDDALREALRRWPATRDGHHAYLGGLLEHTVAVATLAVETCTLHPRLDQELLVTAALVHDLGRTRELRLGAEIEADRRGPAARPRRARPADARRARDARRGLDDARRARARPLRAHPPRRRRRAGAALRLARGARAAPPQRARRRPSRAPSSTGSGAAG